MKKITPTVLVFGILFLFFIQMAGTLIESIYVLDLMNLNVDEKALGLLFFLSPLLLLPFRKKLSVQPAWILFGLLFLARGMTPYLNTFERMLVSGTGAALLLFGLLLSAEHWGNNRQQTAAHIAAGLALAVCLSVMLRTLNGSLDYSLTAAGSWVGWVLGLALGLALTRLKSEEPVTPRGKPGSLLFALLGIFLILTLVYCTFSAPAVIARWTEGSYPLIVSAVSLLSAGWAWLTLFRRQWFERISARGLLLWNAAFTLCLTGTLLAHRVSYPQTPQSAPVVVGEPAWFLHIPLVLMLALFPVIFFDLHILSDRVLQLNPTPRDLVPGMLLGSGGLVLLLFIGILTNVWGYIDPISPFFRNLFWLPYLLAAGVLTLIVHFGHRVEPENAPDAGRITRPGWTAFLAALFLATAAGVFFTKQPQPAAPGKTSLLVMTYNIQAANDGSGQRSYDRQLEVIRSVSPDILALQESDSDRVALNNNDYVRYFADSLGYYSYFGPATVTGTFGTAILSKYPLLNPRTVFSFSDTDEIGTAEAEVDLDGRRFTIFNNHPDGSDTAKLAWAETLLARSQGLPDVIALGDFNLHNNEPVYQRIAAVYTDTWTSLNPSKMPPGAAELPIDHIFLSASLHARQSVYLQPPQSASDHPVHWAEVFWEK